MKHIKMKYGFTLIELLVVVIIIAVLAAVAVPQYKKAVLKSRFSTVMPMAKAVADAQEVYYLGKNMYALYSDELDITPVTAEKTSVQLSSEETPAVSDDYIYVSAKRTDVPGARYMVFQKHSPNYAGNVYCEAGNTDADAICKSIGGVVQEYRMVADTNLYLVSGNGTGLPPGADDEQGGDEPQNANACQAGDTVPDSVQTQMNSVLATAKQNSGNDGISVTANCVNGSWQYSWSGGNEVCCDDYVSGSNSYQFAGSLFNYASCAGDFAYGCSGATFDGGFCDANVEYGCSNSIFTNGSRCSIDVYEIGYSGERGCSGSIFRDGGYCEATSANACAGSIFEEGGRCEANTANGCDDVIYNGGYCYGTYCPVGSPKEDGGTWEPCDDNPNETC